MPNWNTNKLVISNLSNEEVSELTKQIKAEELLTHYVPQPEGISFSVRDEDEEAKVNLDLYGVKDGYNWNLANWDTKWDICDASVSSSGDEIVAYFNTAWSAPIEGLRRVSEKFPNATFVLTYYETGCDFCGATYFKDGVVEESDADITPSSIGDAWKEENHPELYAKAVAEDWEGESSDELDELWWNVSDEVISECLDYHAEHLGLNPIDPEIYAQKRQKEQERDAEIMKAMLARFKTKATV